MDCLFCKMAAGEIPTNKVYEDDTVLAFYDIDPQAPVHVLVVPQKHIASPADITAEARQVARAYDKAAQKEKAMVRMALDLPPLEEKK